MTNSFNAKIRKSFLSHTNNSNKNISFSVQPGAVHRVQAEDRGGLRGEQQHLLSPWLHEGGVRGDRVLRNTE